MYSLDCLIDVIPTFVFPVCWCDENFHKILIIYAVHVVVLLLLKYIDYKMDVLALILMMLYEYYVYLKTVSDYKPPWWIALVRSEMLYSGPLC
jgi:hypothetical protein